MVDEIVTRQELIDAKRDARDLGKAVNEKVIVDPRYGADFKSLPMIAAEAQGAINEWEAAISLITQEDGIPDLAVSTWSGRTQADKNKENISVLDFGAKGDGATDDTAAFQAAVNYCQANSRALFVPEGVYLVSPITTVATSSTVAPLYIKGANWRNTVIQALATQDEIFNISYLSNYSKFENLTLNGKGMAKVGVRSLGAPHTVFRDVIAQGFTEWGLCWLKDSWSTVIDNCKVSYNSGHGMYLGVSCNGVVINDSFIFLNEGWGIVAEGSLNIVVRGGGLEHNKAGGFYGNVLRLPSFQNVYFEANGTVGMTLTPIAGVAGPTLTVKTNILLNGVQTVLVDYDKYFAGSKGASPIDTFSRGVSVKDCTVQLSSGDISFVTAISVEGLVVNNIVAAGVGLGLSDCVRLIAVEQRSRAQDFSISNIKGFKNNLVVTTNTPSSFSLLTQGIGTIKEGKQYNLVPKDLLSSVDLRYKADSNPLVVAKTTKTYMGLDIYTAKATVASLDNSKGKGFIFDASLPEYAYLRGKVCYVTCLAKNVGNARVETYYNLNFESTHVPVLTTQESGFYYRKTVRFTFPETGFVEVGFYLSNVTNIATDYAEIAQLVVAPVGVDYREL